MREFEEKEDRMKRRKNKILLNVHISFIFLKVFDLNVREWRELQELMRMEEEWVEKAEREGDELVEIAEREGDELSLLTEKEKYESVSIREKEYAPTLTLSKQWQFTILKQ